jgi:hypothetical protein
MKSQIDVLIHDILTIHIDTKEGIYLYEIKDSIVIAFVLLSSWF